MERGENVGEHVATPTEHVKAWPPKAAALLAAAKRLLITRGYEGLTWEAISAEAEEHKSTIRYYFASKAGLLYALNELLSTEITEKLADSVRSYPSGDQRIHKHVENIREAVCTPESYFFFDVLPHAIRDEGGMRAHWAELFEWHRKMMVECFGVDPTEANLANLRDLASFFMATADGLAIQTALDPENFDPGPGFRILEEAVLAYLKRARAGDADSGPTD